MESYLHMTNGFSTAYSGQCTLGHSCINLFIFVYFEQYALISINMQMLSLFFSNTFWVYVV